MHQAIYTSNTQYLCTPPPSQLPIRSGRTVHYICRTTTADASNGGGTTSFVKTFSVHVWEPQQPEREHEYQEDCDFFCLKSNYCLAPRFFFFVRKTVSYLCYYIFTIQTGNGGFRENIFFLRIITCSTTFFYHLLFFE